MPAFSAHDGTDLAYHVFGEGTPVICLPGGPMQDSAYLGELGGLAAHGQLIMVDLRGTGRSATPADAATYRCDRLVDDVEALREHLGLDRLDLLAHCAGANLATLYAARHPERVAKLALITPSTMAVGIAATGASRLGPHGSARTSPGSQRPSRRLKRSSPATAPAAGRPSSRSSTADGTRRPRPTRRPRSATATRKPRPRTAPRAPTIRRPPARRSPRSTHRYCCLPERWI